MDKLNKLLNKVDINYVPFILKTNIKAIKDTEYIKDGCRKQYYERYTGRNKDHSNFNPY